MRDAKASSHRLLKQSPLAANRVGRLDLESAERCDKAANPESLGDPRKTVVIQSLPKPSPEICADSIALASPFKKACPFEFTRHVRLQADTEFRPCLLPKFGESV